MKQGNHVVGFASKVLILHSDKPRMGLFGDSLKFGGYLCMYHFSVLLVKKSLKIGFVLRCMIVINFCMVTDMMASEEPLKRNMKNLILSSANTVNEGLGSQSHFHSQSYMMNKMIDRGRPEPILFLLEALDAMREYHESHKEFPENWSALDINFANGPFYIGDPNTYPTANTGSKWRPKGCEYTYWIKTATKESFVIQALNQNNVPEYEITQALDYPESMRD